MELQNFDISLSDSVIEEIDHSRERKRKLKKDFIELGKESQLHGIKPMITKPSIIKIIWFVFFLVSMGICAYTIITTIQQYLSFKVNTLVQVVPQNTVTFPTVSVCNQNPLVTPQAFQYITDHYSNAYNIKLTNYPQFYELVENKTIPDDTDWLFYRTFDSRFNRTLRDSLGYRIDEMTLFCTVQFYKCDYDEFRSFYHPKYGNCFIFNSGVHNNGSTVALEYVSIEEIGIDMEIFSGLADNKNPYIYEPSSRGFVIMIGEQNDTSLDQDGIFSILGFNTAVAMRKTISTNLPKPYNDCFDSNSVVDTALAGEMRRRNISYSRHNCFTMCKQMIIIEKLGCYDMRYPSLFDAKPCSDKRSFEILKNIDLDLNKCQSECPFECETTIYEWDISYTDYQNKENLYNLKRSNSSRSVLERIFQNNSYSLEDIKQTTARFWIYFDPLIFKIISQSPSMTFADLIANIGGALGLFLGISILSLVELIEICILFLENYSLYRFKLSKKYETRPNAKSELDKTSENEYIESNDDREMKIWPEIAKVLKKSGKTTTLHGLPKILTTNRRYVKTIWLVFTLISIGICIFMITKTITDYLQYELKSQIRQMPHKSVKFPSIQICNMNNFVTPEANAYLNEFYLTNFGYGNFTSIDDIIRTNSTLLSYVYLAFYQTFLPNFNETRKKLFGYSLEDLIVACEFDSKPCNRSWFEWNYNSFYGNCYVFNSGFLNGEPNVVELLHVDKPNTGLYLELFHGVPEEYSMSIDYLNGIAISINDQGHTPNFKNMQNFKPGSSASINLGLTHFTNLPAPYSECQHTNSIESDIVKKMRQFNISYDRFNCLIYCQQMLNYYGMGCFKVFVTNIYQVKVCETLEQLYDNQNVVIDDRVCPIMCPAECEQNSYDFEASFSDFPSKNYAFKLVNDRKNHYEKLFHTKNVTYDMIKKSMSSYYFYFDELVVTEIIESPSIQFIDLISNIGGIFGLFVGISVLSFIELIDLTVNIANVIIRFMRLKKKNKRENSA